MKFWNDWIFWCLVAAVLLFVLIIGMILFSRVEKPVAPVGHWEHYELHRRNIIDRNYEI